MMWLSICDFIWIFSIDASSFFAAKLVGFMKGSSALILKLISWICPYDKDKFLRDSSLTVCQLNNDLNSYFHGSNYLPLELMILKEVTNQMLEYLQNYMPFKRVSDKTCYPYLREICRYTL